MAELKLGAVVRVRLTFAAPDEAPDAQVFFGGNDGVFTQAVLKRVRAYRMPCLQRGERRVAFRFDFTTMGCPFEVHLPLWQPHAKNSVGELERLDPNRREFVEWLRNVDVNAPKRLHDEIVGDSMNIAVPCGVLDLL